MNWQSQIISAAKRIEPFIVKTHTFSSHTIFPEYIIELKFEHLQHTGSFKPRGAFNSLLSANVPNLVWLLHQVVIMEPLLHLQQQN